MDPYCEKSILSGVCPVTGKPVTAETCEQCKPDELYEQIMKETPKSR